LAACSIVSISRRGECGATASVDLVRPGRIPQSRGPLRCTQLRDPRETPPEAPSRATLVTGSALASECENKPAAAQLLQLRDSRVFAKQPGGGMRWHSTPSKALVIATMNADNYVDRYEMVRFIFRQIRSGRWLRAVSSERRSGARVRMFLYGDRISRVSERAKPAISNSTTTCETTTTLGIRRNRRHALAHILRQQSRRDGAREPCAMSGSMGGGADCTLPKRRPPETRRKRSGPFLVVLLRSS